MQHGGKLLVVNCVHRLFNSKKTVEVTTLIVQFMGSFELVFGLCKLFFIKNFIGVGLCL